MSGISVLKKPVRSEIVCVSISYSLNKLFESILTERIPKILITNQLTDSTIKQGIYLTGIFRDRNSLPPVIFLRLE